MQALKDWSKNVSELGDMDVPALENVYSEMLATAHDLNFKVEDALLVETQDPARLREVIPPLHEAITKFHAELKKAGVEKAPRQRAPAKKTAAKKAVGKKAPKKPADAAAQKEQEKVEDTMNSTAKKAPAKKAAKKVAKVAKKKASKAASANARTGVARSSFSPDAKITVKLKANPAREGSGKFDRIANLMKYNGKTVKQFLDSSLGRTGTLSFSVAQGWITVK